MSQYNTSSTAKSAPLNHELYMSVLMTPDMANFIGNVHGVICSRCLTKSLMLAPVATVVAMS